MLLDLKFLEPSMALALGHLQRLSSVYNFGIAWPSTSSTFASFSLAELIELLV